MEYLGLHKHVNFYDIVLDQVGRTWYNTRMKNITLIALAFLFNDFVSDVFVAIGRVTIRLAQWFGSLPEFF